MTIQTFDSHAHDLLEQFIAHGFCEGKGEKGELCIMQALNLAERGLSDAKGIADVTDSATCVAPSAQRLAIRLNDTKGYYYHGGWSSNAARAKGLRKLAHALLGSKGIDEKAWRQALGRRYIREILPIALRKLAELRRYETSKSALLTAASRCEQDGSVESARAAGAAARAARDTPRPVVAAEAVEAAEAAAVAAAEAAAAVAVAEAAAVAVEAAAVAAAEAAAGFWDRYYPAIAKKRDEMLTRCADLAAEELELAKAARDAKVFA